MLQAAHVAKATDENVVGAIVGATLMEHSRIIWLKRETTSSKSDVEEERRPEARETAVRIWLKAVTKAGLAWRSNSSNSLNGSTKNHLVDPIQFPLIQAIMQPPHRRSGRSHLCRVLCSGIRQHHHCCSYVTRV
jgi:hypothetical protein